MEGTRKKFYAAFKREALRIAQENNRKLSDVVRELGIRPELLYRWKSEQIEDPSQAFPGKGHRKPDEAYVQKLERELKRAQEDREILKKALAYFSSVER